MNFGSASGFPLRHAGSRSSLLPVITPEALRLPAGRFLLWGFAEPNAGGSARQRGRPQPTPSRHCSTPSRRGSWSVPEIERYRQEHGIKDPEHALGREHGTAHDWSRDQPRQRLQQRQMELQRAPARNMGREAGHSLEIGL